LTEIRDPDEGGRGAGREPSKGKHIDQVVENTAKKPMSSTVEAEETYQSSSSSDDSPWRRGVSARTSERTVVSWLNFFVLVFPPELSLKRASISDSLK
jgi:hypothetical protein